MAVVPVPGGRFTQVSLATDDSADNVTDNWGEVIGQADAVDQLRASVANPVHAYLFLGPHGSGRWSAAKAFAAEVLSAGLDPDAAERAARLALRGEHPDLIRIDPTGN